MGRTIIGANQLYDWKNQVGIQIIIDNSTQCAILASTNTLFTNVNVLVYLQSMKLVDIHSLLYAEDLSPQVLTWRNSSVGTLFQSGTQLKKT